MKLRRFFSIVGLSLFFIFLVPTVTLAQTKTPHPDEFYQGVVTEIVEDHPIDTGGILQPFQRVRIQITIGPDKGQILLLDYGGEISIEENQKVHQGDRVVLAKTWGGSQMSYQIHDLYRLPSLGWMGLLFLIVAGIFGALRGFTSIAGMIFSLLALTSFVIPRILAGGSPLLISFLGACGIAVISLYLAHGINKRTSVALFSTIITLGISAGFSILFVTLARLSGAAQEEAAYLHLDGFPSLDLRGLLMGGIIIGALGILDDVTTAQVAVVDELKKANPSLSRRELYRRGLSVGREHIASLINTLVLAYAGASFPLLLIFAVDKSIPMWVNINGEFVAEEVVRTLAGSMALILAVPISTLLGAHFSRKL